MRNKRAWWTLLEAYHAPFRPNNAPTREDVGA